MLEFGYIDMFSEGVTFTNLGFVREFHGRAAAATKALTWLYIQGQQSTGKKHKHTIAMGGSLSWHWKCWRWNIFFASLNVCLFGLHQVSCPRWWVSWWWARPRLPHGNELPTSYFHLTADFTHLCLIFVKMGSFLMNHVPSISPTSTTML